MRELVLAASLLLPDRVQKEAPPAKGGASCALRAVSRSKAVQCMQ